MLLGSTSDEIEASEGDDDDEEDNEVEDDKEDEEVDEGAESAKRSIARKARTATAKSVCKGDEKAISARTPTGADLSSSTLVLLPSSLA